MIERTAVTQLHTDSLRFDLLPDGVEIIRTKARKNDELIGYFSYDVFEQVVAFARSRNGGRHS